MRLSHHLWSFSAPSVSLLSQKIGPNELPISLHVSLIKMPLRVLTRLPVSNGELFMQPLKVALYPAHLYLTLMKQHLKCVQPVHISLYITESGACSLKAAGDSLEEYDELSKWRCDVSFLTIHYML